MQEKEQLGNDLFANLAKLESMNGRVDRGPMLGILPGQSQIGKQERAQLTEGKARRDVVKNMLRGGAAAGGRRPLVRS